GGDLGLDDGSVVFFLLRFGVILGVHHKQVVAAREDDGLLVGRDRGPARLPRRLEIFEQREFGRRQFVFKVDNLVSGRRWLLLLRSILSASDLLRVVLLFVLPASALLGFDVHLNLFLRAGDVRVPRNRDVELKGGIFLDELDCVDRQVLRVIRDARQVGQHRRHFGVVEEGRFGLARRVDNVELLSLAGFIAVPEAVAVLQPTWRDRSVEDQFADLLRSPTRGQFIIGFAHTVVLIRFVRLVVLSRQSGRRQNQTEAQREGEEALDGAIEVVAMPHRLIPPDGFRLDGRLRLGSDYGSSPLGVTAFHFANFSWEHVLFLGVL